MSGEGPDPGSVPDSGSGSAPGPGTPADPYPGDGRPWPSVPLDTEGQDFGQGDASFRAAGGFEGLVDLVERFYRQMDELPEAARIRAMHPADLTLSRDKLARFLAGWLGGPRLYDEAYGPIRIPMAHRHLDVGVAERDAWLACMRAALDETDHTPVFKRYLLRALAVPAERIRVVASR